MHAMTPTVALAERLCRPQRIGLVGRRGVGKTTLLTMLYREAAGGRLAGLRLAAADARTANYLSDKVLLLEAGQPLPATLAETDLSFHLYQGGSRLELLLKDYQGEHLALGRTEPIRDFLRDCDVVWLCLDAGLLADTGARLRAQQEVEQVVEDYLAADPGGAPHRPMALVLTKADQLPPGAGAEAGRHFDMTCHALAAHCPGHAVLAVSSLGGSLAPTFGGPFRPNPTGLEGPLSWLARALQAQDEARLQRLEALAPRDPAPYARGVACFARRYPDAPAAGSHRDRLRQMSRTRLQRRGLAGAAVTACLLLGLWTYDAWGEQRAARFAADNTGDPRAVRQNWKSYQLWHPTRNLLRPSRAREEGQRLAELDNLVRERQCAERLAGLRRQAADPDADPDASWQEFQRFHADFPDYDVGADLQALRTALKARRDEGRARQAGAALGELVRAEGDGNVPAQIVRADRFLRDFGDTPAADEARRRRAAYLARLDEGDIEPARAYSTLHPFNFHTRREHYQRYLDRHPAGRYAGEAREALEVIGGEWDRHDFRAVRDHFQAQPGEVQELASLCRHYLAVHPSGRFADPARELLRWGERVSAPGEYRVVLRGGSFDPRIGAYFSRGPSLSVEIEVNGVRHGPSPIAPRSCNPTWEYEFPRLVRWKLGDKVRITVTDHYFWQRKVLTLESPEGDPVALRLLSGEVQSGPHTLTFASDFGMPTLPPVE